MNKIKFLRGLKSNYDPVAFKDYLYFALDTKEIIVDGTSYGVAYEEQHLDTIIRVEKGLGSGELIFVHRDGSSTKIVIPIASKFEDGLMSKEDKRKLDDLHERSLWIDLDLINNAFASSENLVLESSQPMVHPAILDNGSTVKVNLNNNTVYSVTSDPEADATVLEVHDGTLVLEGDGIVNAGSGNKYQIAVCAIGKNAKVVINGGTYTNGPDHAGDYSDLIYAKNGASIEIFGGVFDAVKDSKGKSWALNLHDATNNISKITCYGGYFVNFDPANPHCEPAGWTGSFVAPGYKSVLVDGTINDYQIIKA